MLLVWERNKMAFGVIVPVCVQNGALAHTGHRDDQAHLSRFLDFMRKVTVCGLYPPSFAAESVTEDAVLQRDARN